VASWTAHEDPAVPNSATLHEAQRHTMGDDVLCARHAEIIHRT
jgi:hypothetical protein